jgi:hypothetical protein
MRLRWLLFILPAALPLLAAVIGIQPAAASSVVHAAAASPAIHAAAASPAAALAAPSGCPKGDVCFYYKGNGGDLCGYTDTNSTNLHGLAPYGNNCYNIGPSGSIYNNGTSCSGCSGTKLYYDSGYAGAWYCLPMGSYLLHIEQNHFYGGGSSADGHGQTLAYDPPAGYGPGPGGVASVHWTTC